MDTPRAALLSKASEDPPKATTLVLGAEDEAFVRGMRRRLSELTAAVAEEPVLAMTRMTAAAPLEAVELLLRGELARGNFDLLPDLLPSFVFLAVMATVDRERALSLSRRAGELVVEARAA